MLPGILAHLLYQVDARDPLVLVTAASLLLLAGGLASLIPALQAMRVSGSRRWAPSEPPTSHLD